MTNRTAATRYARALLDVAVHEKSDLHRIEGDLASFAELLARYPDLERALINPVVPIERKRGAVSALTSAGGVSPLVSKLLRLLADRDRLVLLPDLVAAYRERLLDYEKIVRAEVTTAAPLSGDRARAIEQGLARMTGRTVRLATRVDPSIIGGVVARIGSTIYDGSVTRQLERMKERLAAGE